MQNPIRTGPRTAIQRVAAALLVAAPLAAFAQEHGAGHGSHGEHAGHAEHTPAGDLDPAPLPPGSLFQLESAWTGADGRALRLSELGGRVQVLAMVYTHCEHACPRIIADMRRIRSVLGDTGDRVGYALVSLDPERDDVERLVAFRKQTGLGDDWRLLRAGPGAVRELAAALGVRFRRISEQDFVHSNLISVLDPDGVVVHRQVGLGVDPERTVAAIRALLGERADAPSGAADTAD